jgi:pimeloyl-ACP methyl ester carboxylesterase
VSRKLRGPRLIAIMVLLALALTTALGFPVMAASSPGACQDKVAILLAGLGTTSDEVTEYFPVFPVRRATVSSTFADIETHVLQHLGYTRAPIRFSYEGNRPYGSDATFRHALPHTAPRHLHELIHNYLTECPDATFDLIGYSLGGVIAFAYLSMYAAEHDEISHIKHVITLDAPVNGLPAPIMSILGAAHGFIAMELFPTGTCLNALASSASREANMVIARHFDERGTIIRTIAANNDLIIPVDNSVIPGFDRIVSVSHALDDVLQHGRVLHDPGALAIIAQELAIAPPSRPGSAPTRVAITALDPCFS